MSEKKHYEILIIESGEAAETDEILGFTAIGTEAGELMAMVQTAMMAKIPDTAEGLNVLFTAVPAVQATASTQARPKTEMFLQQGV